MMPLSELDAAVSRFRAGEVYEPSSNPDSDGWQHVMAPLMSMAAADLENQLERLDEFSLPLLPPISPDFETLPARTHPARTAQVFLSQLRSDFRCVAGPHIDLVDVEKLRHTREWEAALEARNIKNRSVAVLAVGRYLDFGHTQDDLVNSLKPWLDAADNSQEMEWFETDLGPVVGPLVHLALQISYASQELPPPWAVKAGEDWGRHFVDLALQISDASQELPLWASHVGEDWGRHFLRAGALELLPAARYIHASY
jgi:hypothetical protein